MPEAVWFESRHHIELIDLRKERAGGGRPSSQADHRQPAGRMGDNRKLVIAWAMLVSDGLETNIGRADKANPIRSKKFAIHTLGQRATFAEGITADRYGPNTVEKVEI
jgi:hypothetical protein